MTIRLLLVLTLAVAGWAMLASPLRAEDRSTTSSLSKSFLGKEASAGKRAAIAPLSQYGSYKMTRWSDPPPLPENVVGRLNRYSTPQLEGQVTGADNAPMGDVPVRVIRLAERVPGGSIVSDSRHEVVAETSTAVDGQYSVELPPFTSSLVVQIDKPGWYAARSLSETEKAATFAHAPEAPPRVSAILKPYSPLAGQLLLPNGSPAGEVALSAWMALPDRDRQLQELFRPAVEGTRTDKAGRFELTKQPGGPVWVSAETTDGLRLHDLVKAPQTNLKLSLSPADAAVAGRVILLPDDAPLSGTRIFLSRIVRDGDLQFSMSQTTTTDDHGYYRFTSLYPGSYRSILQGTRELHPFLTPPPPVELAAGEQILLADHAVFSGYQLRVRVLENGSGIPIPGALVRADSLEQLTGIDGVAIFDKIAPRSPETSLLVQVRKAGFFTSSREQMINETVRLDAEELVTSQDFELSRLSSLRGRVHTPQGVPVAGALVKLEENYRTKDGLFPSVHGVRGKLPQVATEGDGSFELHGIPPDGIVRLQAASQGYALSLSEPVDLDNGTVTADIVLGAGGSVGGKVVDAAGRHVAGSTVTAKVYLPIANLPHHSYSMSLDTAAGTDGIFLLTNLPADRQVMIQAHAAGYADSTEHLIDSKEGITTSGLLLTLQLAPR